ncbi:hypothetical protein HYH02_008879 [Chlamydomonas schloesseri]|uniref:Uncharacterized protein n=1 Tax=Chlamydomonas schloesseri TaxID=2026947 RepID=A0A836B1K3_9CHLO|nr:hypothetical protein HYH02_008879 [Chlamydomonas schloesseri]|eukprot:KAG2445010.1 hypothetical protein HYH02_008879 [Chlamydomonas schloesseri]
MAENAKSVEDRTPGMLIRTNPGKEHVVHVTRGETINDKACMICLESMPESDRWAVKHLGADDAHFGVHKDCGEQLGGRCPACREPASGLINVGSGTQVYVASNDA